MEVEMGKWKYQNQNFLFPAEAIDISMAEAQHFYS
jgi:hypothetical protein